MIFPRNRYHFHPPPRKGAYSQRSILPNFRLKLISSDSRLATSRWLWGEVSFVRVQVFSQSTGEERAKIPSSSLGRVACCDLRPLGVGLSFRACAKQSAPSLARRFLGSDPISRNAVLLGSRRPKLCQCYDWRFIGVSVGISSSSACRYENSA